MSTIAERVEAGAEFLDRREPGWLGRIDIGSLDIGSCRTCILGQLYGHYFDAIDEQEIDFPDELAFRCTNSSDDEGYGLPLVVESAAITEAWRALILQRRAEAPPRGEPTFEEIAAEKRSSDR